MAAGVARYVAGDAAAARRQFERTLEVNPQFASGLLWLGLVDVIDGRCEEGIARMQRAAELAQSVNETVGTLAYGYGRCGRREEAEALIKRLEERAAKGSVANIALAVALPGVGRRDEAIGWLERALAERHSDLAPAFYRLRSPSWNRIHASRQSCAE